METMDDSFIYIYSETCLNQTSKRPTFVFKIDRCYGPDFTDDQVWFSSPSTVTGTRHFLVSFPFFSGFFKSLHAFSAREVYHYQIVE
jgi:hypothetical protein